MFTIGQSLVLASATPCNGHSHDAGTVSFRRYEGFGHAEVMTCRGSVSVPVSALKIF